MRFFQAFHVEIQRSMRSKAFLLQLVLLLVWMYLNSFDIFTSEIYMLGFCWQAVLNQATTSQFNFANLLMILGTIGYAWSYCTDHDGGYDGEAVRRVGPVAYGTAKLTATLLSSFCAASLAVLLYALFLQALSLPPSNATYLWGATAYLSLVAEGNSGLYLLFRCLVTGLSCSLAACIALTVSAFVQNLYTTLLSPLLLFLAAETVLALVGAEPRFFGGNVMFFQCFPDDRQSVIWAVCYLSDLILISGLIFVWKLRKEYRP